MRKTHRSCIDLYEAIVSSMSFCDRCQRALVMIHPAAVPMPEDLPAFLMCPYCGSLAQVGVGKLYQREGGISTYGTATTEPMP